MTYYDPAVCLSPSILQLLFQAYSMAKPLSKCLVHLFYCCVAQNIEAICSEVLSISTSPNGVSDKS